MLWRPAYEWRGTRKHWITNSHLNAIEMSLKAATSIYSVFSILPIQMTAANDSDGKWW